MKQKPFNTTKRKIETFRNSEIDKSTRVSRQETLNNAQIDQTKQDNTLQYELKRKKDESSEWTLIEPIDLNGDTLIDQAHVTFTVEFDQFDIRLIPYLDTKIIIRPSDGSVDDTTTFSFLFMEENVFFEIVDIVGEEFFKKLKVFSSVYFSVIQNVEIPYYAKMVCTFINPRNYH